MNIKIIIVGFDGLRPDLITSENMPNLTGFVAQSSLLANHRSVYPSETRVNITSLSTGSWPESHGVIANEYVDFRIPQLTVFNTAKADHIDTGERVYGGKFVGSSSLGEAVTNAGLTFAVIATGSQGSSRLLSHKMMNLPHLSIACASPETSRPLSTARRLIDAAGGPPVLEIPETELVRFATDLFISHVYPEFRPDVTVLWYVEPDTSFHCFGLAKSGDVLRFVDREFGRILDWANDHPEIQIMAISDHGHVAGQWPMDLMSAFEGLNLKTANQFDPEADLIVIPGQTTGIWVNPVKREILPDVGAALMNAPWSGPIFAKEPDLVPGSFSQDQIRACHPRSPDLYCARYANSQVGAANIPGCAFVTEHDGLPIGSGQHGGLQREEMTSLAAMRGTLFRSNFRSEVPSGIVDIAPTVLHILGIPQPSSMTGRPLKEVIADHDWHPPKVEEEVLEKSYNNYLQILRRRSVDNNIYLDHAERLAPPPA